MIIKLFRKAFPKLPTLNKLFRKAFPNCFAKLPEAGKLFNLAATYVPCEVFPKLPQDFANFSSVIALGYASCN